MRCPKRLSRLLPVLAFVGLCSFIPNAARADIIYSGDFSLNAVGGTAGGTLTINTATTIGNGSTLTSNYISIGIFGEGVVNVDGVGATWTNSPGMSQMKVSNGYPGTLNITNGGVAIATGGVGIGIGSASDSGGLHYAMGTVTVAGANSLWNVGGTLYVGTAGDNATLNIQSGGSVSVAGGTYVASSTANTTHQCVGLINMNGGTLSTQSLWASTSQLAGNGTIHTKGLWSDVDLSFDSGHGLRQTIPIGTVSVKLDMSDSTSMSELGAGYLGDGTIRIADNVTVDSQSSCLGFAYGSSGAGTVTNATWNIARDLNVGYNQGNGILYINNGGLVSVGGKTAVTPNTAVGWSAGTISLNGGTLDTRSLWVAPGQLTGTGTVNTRGLVSDVNLSFDSNHDLIQTVPVGTVSVNLNMSDSNNVGDLGVGYQDSGSLLIANGRVVPSAAAYIGYSAAATGVATVTDADSTWAMSTLYIGSSGVGTLNVKNGATVACSATTMLGNVMGTLSVDGSGSTVNTGSDLFYLVSPGAAGSARLSITNGGVVNSPSPITISGYANITVDGSGSSWNTGDLTASFSGTGILTISQGGHVTTDSSVSLSSDFTATVSGAGSMWSVGSQIYQSMSRRTLTLTISNGGTFCGGISSRFRSSGTASITIDGGIVKAESDTLWNGSNFAAPNVYVGTQGATFDTNGHSITLQQMKLLTTGADGGITKLNTGTLTLTGANTYTGRTILQAGLLELGPAAQFVVLTGGGADIQHGKMVFDYTGAAPNIAALLDDSYGTGGSMVPWTTGQFRCTIADPNHGLGWVDNGSEVTVMYTLYGDSNLDGSVNGSDLNAVLSNYNLSGEWEHGDFNYDGSVNGSDLNTVLSNYNRSLSASTAAVPEPSTLLLMVLGLVGLLAWRKRFGIARRA